ncbi:D-cysteine desulfhydrase family protein [Mycolicibacterium sp. P9-64]|uniref:D-cysteine desulfhydrase family protein n=1 Tax=Mycolicibacterium sp. P9-64 TaxID=2024612 RepID=UPI0011ED8C3D|nr:D-cysteine desulfhydrase family protein [Mycolicibacterium sp. P9-64]KAA0075610.1 D-cysteine desulfhydrase family protein [Mycolicibacterium sp. P9-64]
MASEPTPVQLITGPTPLEPAPRLSAAIGLRPTDLWIKRDDLIGLGGGGNKVRKLQWTCAQALASGADTLITSGAAQSNHARLTAAAGARLGLRVVLVLAGSDPGELTGNLALDSLFGASVVWSADRGGATLQAQVDDVAAELASAGRSVAVIPFGGSSPLTTNAYLDAAHEIQSQGVDPDHVVVAVGSGATMAGLVRGFGPHRVLGVQCGAVTDPHDTVQALFPARDPAPTGLRIRMDQVGAGYGHVTPEVTAALTLAGRTEGIVFDPVYTGRALAGLIAEVQDGSIEPGSTVVLVHTGGLPGLFGSSEFLARLGEVVPEAE